MIRVYKSKTVAVSGHRTLEKDFDYKKIEDLFLSLIKENKADTFLVGMALGFDTVCFKILEKIRKKENIRIIACIPCLNQADYFSEEQKREYKRMVNSADEKIILYDKYTKTCMLERNELMVDNCGVLVAYLRKNTGGTAYTVNRAIKKGVKIIYV